MSYTIIVFPIALIFLPRAPAPAPAAVGIGTAGAAGD